VSKSLPRLIWIRDRLHRINAVMAVICGLELSVLWLRTAPLLALAIAAFGLVTNVAAMAMHYWRLGQQQPGPIDPVVVAAERELESWLTGLTDEGALARTIDTLERRDTSQLHGPFVAGREACYKCDSKDLLYSLGNDRPSFCMACYQEGL
jgi:hypothetical protein